MQKSLALKLNNDFKGLAPLNESKVGQYLAKI